MRNTLITSILAIGLTTALAIAAGPPVTYTFQGGDPASATQVNANFQELADRIADAQASDIYDYHHYVTDPGIQSKKYNTTGRCGDEETRTYTRVAVTDGTKVTEERINTDKGATCAHNQIDYLSTTTEYQHLAIRGYDSVTGVLVSMRTLDNPITRRTSTMRVNSSWADVATATTTPSGTSSTFIEKSTLAAIEDVTVPYNGGTTYTACLKIHRTTQSPSNPADNLTTGHSENIIWYCPGVGMIKNIAITASGTIVTRELSGIQ